MTRAERTSRRALTRRRVAVFLRALGVALTAGAGVSALAVLADRLAAFGAPMWALIGIPAAIAVLTAVIAAALHRPGLLAVASDLDRALGLRDRLGNGLALSRSTEDNPFAAVAVEHAERAAETARVRDATPIRLNSWWWAWPMVFALALAGAIFLPVMDLAGRAQRAETAAAQAALRDDAARDLADAQRALAPPDPADADLATDAQLDTLAQIEEQLTTGDVDADRARADAAAALSDAADRLDAHAKAEERGLDALRDRLARSAEDAAADHPIDSPLAQAISAGDFESAQRAIEQYQQAFDSMDPAERARIAEELRAIAEDADRAAQTPTPDAAPSPAEEALRDQGVDEDTIESLRDQTDEETIRDALRDQGLDEPAAEELADRVAKEHQDHRSQKRAREDAQRLGDALHEAADDATKTNPPAQPNPSGDQPPRTGDSQEPQTKPDETPSQSPAAPDANTPKDDSRPGATPEQSNEEPGAPDQPKRTGDAQPRSSEHSQPTAPRRDSPANTERGPESGPSQPGAAQQQPGGDQPQGQPADSEAVPKKPSDQPNPASDHSKPGTQKNAPGMTPPDGAAPGDSNKQQPTGSGVPEPGARGLERARRLMRELRDRQGAAHESHERAEEARRQAQQMLDRMSPTERERLARWAKALAREDAADRPASTGFDHAPVDLRPKDADADRVIAQWYDKDNPGGSGATSTRAVEDHIQQAARGAERAVEEHHVHARYSEIVKRYFEYARRAKAPKPAPKPPTPSGG